MVNLVIWNEFVHEQEDEHVKSIYPNGIHGCIKEFLSNDSNLNIKTATLEEKEHGLTKDLLENTDVLIWWGHKAHNLVEDKIVDRVQQRILEGMGLIVLHSGHHSKIFKRMMGTTANLRWAERVVIGCENKKSENIMRELYRPLYLLETPIVSTTVESAEIIKYASNSFLATKISFINQVADLCEKVGADVQDVAKGMGIDKRIGNKFLHAGPGYGGSCFPKDVKAFIRTAKKHNVDLSILSSVDSFNEERVKKITNNFFSRANLIKGDKVSLLGLSFKPNTDDVRDSTSLKIAKLLQDKGIFVKSYDPEAMDNAKKENTELQLCDSAYDACEEAKAIIIGTEWNEFRALDFLKIKGSSKNLVIFDLRNIYNAKEIEDLGFQYFGTGK
ncbi:nucleotide sugar dehydrogenase [Alphaproteobacteria bacterium]|nr:nucleotide sugar dehydrogenase [Alphaproteobacteria bacterium]